MSVYYRFLNSAPSRFILPSLSILRICCHCAISTTVILVITVVNLNRGRDITYCQSFLVSPLFSRIYSRFDDRCDALCCSEISLLVPFGTRSTLQLFKQLLANMNREIACIEDARYISNHAKSTSSNTNFEHAKFERHAISI